VLGHLLDEVNDVVLEPGCFHQGGGRRHRCGADRSAAAGEAVVAEPLVRQRNLGTVRVGPDLSIVPGLSVGDLAVGVDQAGDPIGTAVHDGLAEDPEPALVLQHQGEDVRWTPIALSVDDGVTLGTTVAPAGPGLGTTAANLASAPAGGGFGTSTLSANLPLAIPALTRAGRYDSALTLSAVTAFP
jgi:hypothetical protein